jgi:hypothetical protein
LSSRVLTTIQPYLVLFYIGLFVLFIAVFFILKNWTRQTVAFKWLLAILLFSFFCDLLSTLNRLFTFGLPFNFAGNLHTMFNPFLVALFFYFLIKGRILMFVLIVFLVANFIFSINLSMSALVWGSYNTLTEGFLILALSILWYFTILKNLPTQSIQTLPEFWIVTGFFLPTAGKVIIYTVSTYLMNVMKDNLFLLASIHNFLNLLGNSLIAYGAFINYRELKIRISSR